MRISNDAVNDGWVFPVVSNEVPKAAWVWFEGTRKNPGQIVFISQEKKR